MKKLLLLAFIAIFTACSKTEQTQPKKEKVKYNLEIQYSDSSNIIPIN